MGRILFILLLCCSPCSAQTLQDVINRTNRGIVKVNSYESPNANSYNAGTGTLISANTVLTAKHVLRNSYSARIITCDGQRIDVVQQKYSREADICILVLKTPVRGIQPIPISRYEPRIGERVVMGGFGDGFRYFEGYIRQPESGDLYWDVTPLNSKTAIPGDSGGPVFNYRGELISNLWGSNQQSVMDTGGTWHPPGTAIVQNRVVHNLCNQVYPSWGGSYGSGQIQQYCPPQYQQPQQPSYPTQPLPPSQPVTPQEPVTPPPTEPQVNPEEIAQSVTDAVIKYMQDNPDQFKGEDGKDGMDGTDGTNGLQGPQGISIEGPQGPRGPKYELTDADKQEIADLVLADLEENGLSDTILKKLPPITVRSLTPELQIYKSDKVYLGGNLNLLFEKDKGNAR